MSVRTCLMLFMLMLGSALAAQQVDSKEFDHGTVRAWNNPEATFLLTNTSGRQQYILSQHYEPDILITADRRELQPGESTIIRIRYYTEEYGRFDRVVPIYLSTQNEPIVLEVRGKIKSFDPNAFTICPSMTGQQPLLLPSVLIVRVLDAITGEELPGARVAFQGQKEERSIRYKGGVETIEGLKADLYRIEAEHKEYMLHREVVYINRAKGELILELFPLEQVDEGEEGSVELEPVEPAPSDPTQAESTSPTEPPMVVPREPLDPIVSESEFLEDGRLNPFVFKPNNIVFVIDVSSSMDKEDKLPLLKWSMASLIRTLRPEDRLSIIAYSNGAEVLAKGVAGSQTDFLIETVLALEAKGQSYGSEGLDQAYLLAQELLIAEGNNEVILASDGLFNSPSFSKRREYWRAWYRFKRDGIRLSTIGFGRSSYAREFMHELADKGHGRSMEIKDEEQAKVILISNLMDHSRK